MIKQTSKTARAESCSMGACPRNLSGPVWGNLDTDTNTMRNDLPLGRYSGTGTAHLNLTLTLDQNMPEELQGLLGYVDWESQVLA